MVCRSQCKELGFVFGVADVLGDLALDPTTQICVTLKDTTKLWKVNIELGFPLS